MPYRLEIRIKQDLFDAEGAGIARKAREYFLFEIKDIRVIRVLTIDADFSSEQLKAIQGEIFTNPITQESSYSPIARQFDWLIWVGLRPGVRDTEGSTAIEAIEDLLGIKFKPEQSVYTSKIYEIRGSLSRNQVNRIGSDLLANEIIHQWKVYSPSEWDPENGIGFPVQKVVLDHEPSVQTISINSDEQLRQISAERNLALNDRDIPVIREYFLRKEVLKERKRVGLNLPTDVELEYISQARSDHCNHNTFRGLFRYRDLATGREEILNDLFKTCIKEPTQKIQQEKDWVISVLWDNAGVGRFNRDYYYVITGETHNSPSNMEPYGGALTGIVGIYRDPMGTGKGSKLILGMYGFCVGPRDYDGELSPHLHPRRLLDGIIEGVRDGGNKSGIPTTFGHLLFDESYLGKCLVFVTAMGIMPAQIEGKSSHQKTTTPGDLIVMAGGRVGKDGIHGVTAASETYSENTPAGHVQIGDPYTQKKMHDFLLEARDEGLIAYITDNGGGGLSSSVGESARFSNGCRVELDRVPLKYNGLDQWEIWVSESQERMTIGVKPEDIERFMALAEKHSVECTTIGEYNDSGYLRLDYKGKACAYIRMDFLESDFPQWEFDAEWIPPECRGVTEPVISEPHDHGELLKGLLARPNICCRNWITRQYDHEVQGGSVVKPLLGKNRSLPSDASVVRPVLDTNRAIAVSQALNPVYSKIDTYYMVGATIDEAVRRVLAVGGNPEHLSGVDNFCWPSIQYDPRQNPDGRYKAAQLVRAGWALRDFCLAYRIPLLSGKDSMYIDGDLKGPWGERRRVSGLPTLLFTVCSVIEDISNCVTMDTKNPGDIIYVLGKSKNELGASEYYQMMGATGLNLPKPLVTELWPGYIALHRAIREGLIASCHSVSRGGLAVHFALVAMAGGLGMEVQLDKVPASKGLSVGQTIYSESCGRFIISVPYKKRHAFEEIFSGLELGRVGVVRESPLLSIIDSKGNTVLQEDLDSLMDSWKKPFGGLI